MMFSLQKFVSAPENIAVTIGIVELNIIAPDHAVRCSGPLPPASTNKLNLANSIFAVVSLQTLFLQKAARRAFRQPNPVEKSAKLQPRLAPAVRTSQG
jgi:hypothetical protein